jgi:hypothetical protein
MEQQKDVFDTYINREPEGDDKGHITVHASGLITTSGNINYSEALSLLNRAAAAVRMSMERAFVPTTLDMPDETDVPNYPPLF